jgi:hypothetical protein
MAQRFLELGREDRADILQALAARLGRTALVLEKDVWVCWTLESLFALPGRRAMAFKGGTSLSKVYGVIARFSEDLDITIDCRGLVAPFDPFSETASGSARKKYGKALSAAMVRHVREVLEPQLAAELKRQFQGACHIELEEGAEELWVRYESALPPSAGYLERSVLVEFGGRNSLEPSEPRTIRAYMSGQADGLEYPVAEVTVLRPERTFWEKATLIHVECVRGELKAGRDRLSRHWYDLATLADHDIGRCALSDRALLADVVKFKSVFFRDAHASYQDCIDGRLRLTPDTAMAASLRSDFEQMVASGMFEGQPPLFSDVMERLRQLEQAINDQAG